MILGTVGLGCMVTLPALAELPPAVVQQASLVRPVAGSGTPILPVAASTGLSCVPFARLATGIQIQGDAREWWHRAAATYARGQVAERGAVLAFPASGGMTRGHVAVVSQVVGPREIRIDHSNWAPPGTRRGMVTRGVRVVDVSDRNDWTAVRVQAGSDPSALGRVYATHGFIYNRARGEEVLVAAARGRLELAEAGAGVSPHAARHFALASLAFGN
jgi:surface antigen